MSSVTEPLICFFGVFDLMGADDSTSSNVGNTFAMSGSEP